MQHLMTEPAVLDGARARLREVRDGPGGGWTDTGCLLLPMAPDGEIAVVFTSFFRVHARCDRLVPRFCCNFDGGTIPFALEDAAHRDLPWAAKSASSALEFGQGIQPLEIGQSMSCDRRVYFTSTDVAYVVYVSVRWHLTASPKTEFPILIQAMPDATLRQFAPPPPRQPNDWPGNIYQCWGRRRVGDMNVAYYRVLIDRDRWGKPGHFLCGRAHAVLAAEGEELVRLPGFTIEETLDGVTREHVDFCNLTMVPVQAALRVTTPNVWALILVVAERLTDAEWQKETSAQFC